VTLILCFAFSSTTPVDSSRAHLPAVRRGYVHLLLTRTGARALNLNRSKTSLNPAHANRSSCDLERDGLLLRSECGHEVGLEQARCEGGTVACMKIGEDARLNCSQLRKKLITANHILHYHGVVDAYGHISIRHPQKPDVYIMCGWVIASNHCMSHG
jgi:hypothetical protein